MRSNSATFSAFRRAAVNKGLIIAFGLLVIGAGVYWFTARDSDEVVGPSLATIHCKTCGAQQIPPKQVAQIDHDGNGHLKCPKCGKFTASFYESGPVSESVGKP